MFTKVSKSNSSRGNNNKPVATIVGVSTPSEVTLVVDPKIARSAPLEMGEFVVIDYPKEIIPQPVIAMISKIALSNDNLRESQIKTPDSNDKLLLLGRI